MGAGSFSRRARAAAVSSLVLLAAITALFATSACSALESSQSSHISEDGKVIVRVSMYNDSSFPEWRAYVEQQCPDICIEWDNNRNSFSNVIYEAKHDDMADIVCLRKYEVDSARELEPYLADLSSLELASTFEEDALSPFQINGKQCWLPGPGTSECLFANADIFEQYGVAIPTDLASFVKACQELRAQGVEPFAVDTSAGFTNVALIQGFGGAGWLGTADGRSYLKAFEDGSASSVDASGFSSIFDTLRTLKDNGILTADSLSASGSTTTSRFLNGQVAMSKMSTDVLISQTTRFHLVAIPYFGATSEDSVLYTYPVFSAGISKDASSDPIRYEAATEVMNAMLGADGQVKISTNTAGLISYTKDMTLDLQPSLESIRGLIGAGRVVIRQMSSNSFSAASAVMAQLLTSDANDEQLLDTFNSELFAENVSTVVGTSRVSAGIALDSALCSPAASVLAQSVRSQTESSIAVVDTREAASPIYTGTYTSEDVGALVLDGNVYRGSLTGSQVWDLMTACVRYSTTFSKGSIEPYLDYPALGGMTAEMRDDGSIVSMVVASGATVEDDGTYDVVVSARVYAALSSGRSSLLSLFSRQDATLASCMRDQIASVGGLPQPGEYYVVD